MEIRVLLLYGKNFLMKIITLLKEGLAIDRITLQKLFIHITGGEVK